MLRWAGPALVAIALIHMVMAFVLFPGGLARIASAGAFGGGDWAFSDLEALAAFWFLVFAFPTLALGVAVHASWRSTQSVPGARSIGAVLLISVLASGIVLPVSGLWAFVLPAAMLILGQRSAPR